MPGGRQPDACYWFDTASGQFVTSTYYRDRVHPWVADFNRAHPADRWFGKEWAHVQPDLDYEPLSGPDDVVGEGTDYEKKRTFPHRIDGGLTGPGPKYYDDLCTSPYGNDLLLELVKRAIVGEKLGWHEAADLLCVSFSSNDLVGHKWGPDSQEVMDTTLRTDLLIRDLLDYLDAHVGKGRYVLALSADHGICPLPEVARKEPPGAQRPVPALCFAEAEKFLQQRFAAGAKSGPRALQTPLTGQMHFNPAWLKAGKRSKEEAEKALAGWLEQQSYIQKAYTRTELLNGTISRSDPIAQAVRRSFHPERSGDVLFVVKPYCFLSPYLTGTTHGSPHSYDTHVPLLVFGAGVKPRVRDERITPQTMAAILAHALGVPPPDRAEAKLPEGLFVQP